RAARAAPVSFALASRETPMKYRVDIDVANDTKAGLGKFIDGKDPRVLNRVGAFASLFALDLSRFKEPVLVMKTEEPGSKQVLAAQHDRIESVCYDMINHLINDWSGWAPSRLRGKIR